MTVFLKEFLETFIFKKYAEDKKSMQNYRACKELKVDIDTNEKNLFKSGLFLLFFYFNQYVSCAYIDSENKIGFKSKGLQAV